ncbi:MAG: hypothetical protein SF051_04635 [Elusimicrobiota bacterium]|nr:hypothetical protein [Elusimicrobiota bacterium]
MNNDKMRVKLTGFAVAIVAGLAVAAFAHEGEDHSKHGKGHTKEASAAAAPGEAVTVTGEVLDLSCYLGHASKGKEHQKCAKACLLDKKVPAGLLTADGSVLLLVPDHKHEKAFKPVGELAAETVTVRGRKVVSGGLPGILVESVEKAGK